MLTGKQTAKTRSLFNLWQLRIADGIAQGHVGIRPGTEGRAILTCSSLQPPHSAGGEWWCPHHAQTPLSWPPLLGTARLAGDSQGFWKDSPKQPAARQTERAQSLACCWARLSKFLQSQVAHPFPSRDVSRSRVLNFLQDKPHLRCPGGTMLG